MQTLWPGPRRRAKSRQSRVRPGFAENGDDQSHAPSDIGRGGKGGRIARREKHREREQKGAGRLDLQEPEQPARKIRAPFDGERMVARVLAGVEAAGDDMERRDAPRRRQRKRRDQILTRARRRCRSSGASAKSRSGAPIAKDQVASIQPDCPVRRCRSQAKDMTTRQSGGRRRQKQSRGSYVSELLIKAPEPAARARAPLHGDEAQAGHVRSRSRSRARRPRRHARRRRRRNARRRRESRRAERRSPRPLHGRVWALVTPGAISSRKARDTEPSRQERYARNARPARSSARGGSPFRAERPR